MLEKPLSEFVPYIGLYCGVCPMYHCCCNSTHNDRDREIWSLNTHFCTFDQKNLTKVQLHVIYLTP